MTKVPDKVLNVQQASLFSADQLKPQGKNLNIEVLRESALQCHACRLREFCTQVVFGAGNPNEPVIAFVGEAPGAGEDSIGIPFVGQAGKLLTKMIEAMSLNRDDVYICNVVNCRPPANRKPEPDEIQLCSKYLFGQLRAIRPRVIVTLGATAVSGLVKGVLPSITRMRGQWKEWEGVLLMPTFHPAYLLRQAAAKKEVWSDLQEVKRRIGI